MTDHRGRSRAKKIHLLRPGDKTFRCGRPISSGYEHSPDIGKVTCGHCLEPNAAITYSPKRRGHDD